MRGPDVAWITKERWNEMGMNAKKSFPKLAPDFVLELESDTDNLFELKEKMTKWIKNGVRLAWLVAVSEKKTYIYRPNEQTMVVDFSAKLFGEDVLIGFEMVANDILEL